MAGASHMPLEQSEGGAEQAPRFWRRFAALAGGFLLVATIAAAVLVSPRGALANAFVGDSVGLAEAGAPKPKWYRVFHDTIVRKGPDFQSQKTAVLLLGQPVLVTEMREVANGTTNHTRARIVRPLHGWVSKKSAAGVPILIAMNETEDPEEAMQLHQELHKARLQMLDTSHRMDQRVAELRKKWNVSADRKRHPRNRTGVSKVLGELVKGHKPDKTEAIDALKGTASDMKQKFAGQVKGKVDQVENAVKGQLSNEGDQELDKLEKAVKGQIGDGSDKHLGKLQEQAQDVLGGFVGSVQQDLAK